MSQSAKFAVGLESTHQAANLQSRQGHLTEAHDGLVRTLVDCDKEVTYIQRPEVREFHKARIERDLGINGLRVAAMRRRSGMDDGMVKGALNSARHRIDTSRRVLMDFVSGGHDPNGLQVSNPSAYLNAERGASELAEARMRLASVVLVPELKEFTLRVARNSLESALTLALNGDNFYLRTAALGHMARLSALEGDKAGRKEYLSRALQVVRFARTDDPANFKPALRTYLRLRVSSTSAKRVERAILNGGI